MPILQVIVLAVVQGLTEFLPVSSTAHLYLTSWLLGWQTEALYFDIMLHLGTLLAILLYFFPIGYRFSDRGSDCASVTTTELKRNPMLLWLLAIGTVPVGVAGFLFNKQAEGEWRTPWVMGAMLIAVGIVMWVAENAGRRVARPGIGEHARRGDYRAGAGAGDYSGDVAQRDHHFRRAVPQFRPAVRRALFVPAFGPGDWRRRRQDAVGHAQSTPAARSAEPPAFWWA